MSKLPDWHLDPCTPSQEAFKIMLREPDRIRLQTHVTFFCFLTSRSMTTCFAGPARAERLVWRVVMPLHLARKLLANVSSRKSSSTSVPRGIPDADRGPAPEISRPSVVLHATLSSSSRGLEPEAVRSGLEPVTTDEASSHSGQSGSSKLGNRLFLHFEVLDSRRHKVSSASPL